MAGQGKAYLYFNFFTERYNIMRIVMLADLHIGSRWALTDPKVTPAYCPGKQIQEKLYSKWLEATSGKWRRPDVLVLNGDLVDGQGRKSSGVEQWTTDPWEQIEHAAELIRMWKAKKIYVIGGTDYHQLLGNTGFEMEELLARELKAEFYPNQENVPDSMKKRSGYHWFLTFDKVTVHFAHHVGVSKVFHYMSTPIAREMMHARLNDPMVREWRRLYKDDTLSENQRIDLLRELETFRTKVVVRAHAHYFWMNVCGGSVGLILPSWQAITPYMLKKNPLGFSHVGFVGMEVKGENFTFDQFLVKIEEIQRVPHTKV